MSILEMFVFLYFGVNGAFILFNIKFAAFLEMKALFIRHCYCKTNPANIYLFKVNKTYQCFLLLFFVDYEDVCWMCAE